ncbi:hypothetical protein [Streptomyces sp. CAU 1734]|uniref:SCO6745 family protein n=1 Tax=Streptomyces sp. CAU 1734 TaxID=3140360 RepID=UPI003261B146
MTTASSTSPSSVPPADRTPESPARAGRRCHHVLNPYASLVYFSPDLGTEMAAIGITDPGAAYFASRAAALGRVGAGTVSATFYSFGHGLIARYLPAVWETASPERVLAARLRAVDRTLRRELGEETIGSPELAEAARLALRAAEGCGRPGRALYSAHADLPVPAEPHLAYWHAATLLREHRGDSHLAALLTMGLDPVEALVSHTATGRGMTPRWVIANRGRTREEWDAAAERLRGRGVLDADGELTGAGVRLRSELEALTDEIDRGPYEHLGAEGVARLTELGRGPVAELLGAFPAEAFGKG